LNQKEIMQIPLPPGATGKVLLGAAETGNPQTGKKV
jgi:hypothetical protein